MRERVKLAVLLGAFSLIYFVPLDDRRVQSAIVESLIGLREYARDHVLTCLLPAFFVAGAIATFLDSGILLRYLGASAPKVISYAVASTAGTALGVCSCTVLPLFTGIYRRGAGLGPATTFLYSGPAINVLAIVLTAQVLGLRLGIARALLAIVASVLIGLAMHALFAREDRERPADTADPFARPAPNLRALRRAVAFTLLLFALLVFARRLWVSGPLLVVIGVAALRWFDGETRKQWFEESWSIVKLVMPLLFVGVLVAGVLLGRPGSNAGLLGSDWIGRSVGGNSLSANLVAAGAGALMYFATLTEIPILQGLLGHGMGEGPALAMLLAGPSLSLPGLMVVRGVIGTRKALVYAALVVLLSTTAGLGYGSLV